MNETKPVGRVNVKRRTSSNVSSAIASFFLGIVFLLLVWVVFILDLGFVANILVSIMLLFLFLMIVSMLSRTSRVTRVMRREKVSVEKPVIVTNEVKPTSGNFVGSSETKTYHKSNCRFAKLIKPQFRDYSDDEKFFTKRKYKACKSCMKKK